MSAKWPRWLVPICISKPSTVSRRGMAMTPALFTSTSRRGWSRRNRSAKARTEPRFATSSSATSTRDPALADRIRAAAASPFSRFLHASTTWPPREASARAASKPMPLLAPVTMKIRPARSGMSLSVQPFEPFGMVADLSPAEVSGQPARISAATPSSSAAGRLLCATTRRTTSSRSGASRPCSFSRARYGLTQRGWA